MPDQHMTSDVRRDEAQELSSSVGKSWMFLRRRHRLIAGVTLLTVAIAAAYVVVREPTYTASSRLLIDNQVLAVAQQDAIYSISSPSTQLVQSQIEILHSDMLARKVIQSLDLLRAPDDQSAVQTLARLGAFAADSSSNAFANDPSVLRAALDSFSRSLSVSQVGQTFVIDVRFKSNSAKRSADITNELVGAYLAYLAEARSGVAKSASGWLRERMRSLGTSARVIGVATPPIERSGPRAAVILGFAAVCGLLLGGGLALARDLLDKTLRSQRAVSSESGLPCLAVLPQISSRMLRRAAWRPPFQFGRNRGADESAVGLSRDALLDWSLARPGSLYALQVRRLVTLVMGQAVPPRVLGVTSACPREGKTVLAANFARVAAKSGRAVLLADLAHQNFDLSRRFASGRSFHDAEAGAEPSCHGVADQMSPMHFLPAPADGSDGFSNPGQTYQHVASLLRQSAKYDLVVLDLPPLLPFPHALEIASLLDGAIVVTEWGRCPGPTLETALASSGSLRAKFIGVILNRADPKTFGLYDESNPFAVGGGSQHAAPRRVPPRRTAGTVSRSARA